MESGELFSDYFTDNVAYCLLLRNDNRTCYSNSAVALLTSLTSFQRFLCRYQHSSAEIIQELISLSKVRPGFVDSTGRLRRLVTDINNDDNDWVETGRDHDVTEFIGSCLKAVRTELEEESEAATDLDALFRTETEKQLTCTACSREVTPPAEIHFPVFHLPIENCHSLDQCLERLTATTIIHLPDYNCHACHANTFRSSERIAVTPSVLMVRLERYNRHGVKDGRPLLVPRSLRPSRDGPEYVLVGASSHIGETLNSGHFVSIIVNQSQAFLLSDDTQPRRLHGEELEKELSTAFVLFYEQAEEVSRRLEVLSPVKRTPRQSSGDENEADRQLRSRRKRIKVLTSSEDESSSTTEIKKPYRRNLSAAFSEMTTSEEKKKIIRKQKLQELVRKRNLKQSFQESSENESQEDEDDEEANHVGSESEEETSFEFKEKTRIFESKYDSQCQLPGCGERFVSGRTKIMGVEFLSHPRSSLSWICARHSKFVDIENPERQESNSIDSDSERDLTDFIDDSDLSDAEMSSSGELELSRIKRSLRKNTPRDRRNKRNYLEEQGKYQLEIHSLTNRALYLTEEERERRNRRSVIRDQGLNQERGIAPGTLENQESREVFVNGKRILVYPTRPLLTRYNMQCAACQAKIKKGSLVLPAKLCWRNNKLEFNSRKKPFYVCQSHVETSEPVEGEEFEVEDSDENEEEDSDEDEEEDSGENEEEDSDEDEEEDSDENEEEDSEEDEEEDSEEDEER